ncbi:antitoxin HicB [Candidatus Roizmanbacteria bacterium RIFCSPLOWO2_01_FULL_42_14]|uniref:Antitoxin HicB n=3 Tax=Candidatus Roizmaniibacteriota TaxID=1752723 RepID=A0A1F7K059_9BACT|nr:MAG: antitoxin HicB [Candidatus Roizmanbacteria bacterium RIFCSPHIGHO2_12_FULL_42_10]OGK52745.1 MAG: antitoxin HicB [Candidatus Roizmanbacteria bacterium RIFCSPLOWO2_01_FULL_42_14]OGK61232.1 MAG: antitoxin HicB [Candidatus Roizmanbacteria bacterium RIFCSPLOWO2_02_FULL_43_10]
MKTLNYTVVFQKEPEGGYTAFVPLLPGCVTYGKDLAESKKMAREAIELYVESLEAHKEDIPEEDDVFFSQMNIDFSKLNLTHV